MFDRFFKRRSAGLNLHELSDDDYVIQASLSELIGLRLQAKPIKPMQNRPAMRVLAGSHASRFKGRGMDYLESRAYQAGDDIRNMDWRITARTGHPHVKLFQEERERPVLIFTDFSPSMFFASRGRFKSVIASQASALLAWSAIQHGDRIGGIISNNGHKELQAASGKKGALNFIRELEQHSDPRTYLSHPSAAHPVEFNNALKRLQRMALPGTLVFIISDFYQFDDLSRQLLGQIRQRCESVLIRITDSLETSPPPANRYAITDGQRQAVIDTGNPGEVNRYHNWFQTHRQQIEEFSQRQKIPLFELTTHGQTINELKAFFAQSALFKQKRSMR